VLDDYVVSNAYAFSLESEYLKTAESRSRRYPDVPSVLGGLSMPEICRFSESDHLYFNDHNPPHYHVKYIDLGLILEIGTYRVIEGELPPRVLGWWSNGIICTCRVAGELGPASYRGCYKQIAPLV
jgi:hypothetical protein